MEAALLGALILIRFPRMPAIDPLATGHVATNPPNRLGELDSRLFGAQSKIKMILAVYDHFPALHALLVVS